MNEPNQDLVGWMGTEEVNERVETSDNTHCVHLYLIPLEEEVSNFLIFWSMHMCKVGERKKKWNPTMNSIAGERVMHK